MGVIRALYMFAAYGVVVAGFVAGIAGAYSMSRMSIAYGKPMAWFGSCVGLPPHVVPYCRRCQKWSLRFFGVLAVALILALIGNLTGLAQS
jgi:hypothetical protein